MSGMFPRRRSNRMLIQSNAVFILFNNGEFAIIDKEDMPIIKDYNWQPYTRDGLRTTYAKTRLTNKNKHKHSTKKLLMHRLILGLTDKEKIVDHIDGNGLNNSKANLRICDVVGNTHNRRIAKNSSSGFKGVHFIKFRNKWKSTIGLNNRYIFLGYFNTSKEAAIAYDEAAKKYYGEFANLNLPELPNDEAKETFHAEQERKRKHRIQVAKERDFRKTNSSN